jgi:hypothetical protein
VHEHGGTENGDAKGGGDREGDGMAAKGGGRHLQDSCLLCSNRYTTIRQL